MAIHLLGSGHSMVYHGPLRLWAEDGLVKIEDSRDNSYEALSVKEALLRVQAINDMIGNSSEEGEYASEIARLQKFVEQMVELIKRAKEQGMPSDPSARRERIRRRPSSIVVPGSAGMDV